jgi:hypothetical protein
MEIKWTDNDPETGEKRYLFAERFGGYWKFRMRTHRRGESKRVSATRDMWEVVLDMLERRYRRREGVHEEDVKQVQDIIAGLKEPPTIGDD